MQAINISDFRANLSKYLKIASAGEPINLASNGKILATITPPLNQKELARKELNSLASTARIQDVTSSIDSQWDAL